MTASMARVSVRSGAKVLSPLVGDTPAVGRDPVSGMLIAYASISYVHVSEAEWPEILGRFVAFAKGIAEKL